jgi:hypothetical protein
VSDDWKVGDLALCVDDLPFPGCPNALPIQRGRIYHVSAVEGEPDSDGDIGLHLAGVEVPEVVTDDILWMPAFAASRFRKIRPDEHEKCEDEFVTLLETFKRKVEVSGNNHVGGGR